MGNGTVDGIRDVVYVEPETFDAKHTRAIAAELEGLRAPPVAVEAWGGFLWIHLGGPEVAPPLVEHLAELVPELAVRPRSGWLYERGIFGREGRRGGDQPIPVRRRNNETREEAAEKQKQARESLRAEERRALAKRNPKLAAKAELLERERREAEDGPTRQGAESATTR